MALLGTEEIAKVSPFSIFDSIHFLCKACAILHFTSRYVFDLNVRLGFFFLGYYLKIDTFNKKDGGFEVTEPFSSLNMGHFVFIKKIPQGYYYDIIRGFLLEHLCNILFIVVHQLFSLNEDMRIVQKRHPIFKKK